MQGNTRTIKVVLTVAQLEAALRKANRAVCVYTGRKRSFNHGVVEMFVQEHAVGEAKLDFLGIRQKRGGALYTDQMDVRR